MASFLLFIGQIAAFLDQDLDALVKLVSGFLLTLPDVAVHLIDVVPLGCQNFKGIGKGGEDVLRYFPSFNIFGDVKVLPSLETFISQEPDDACIPSVLGNVGHFQREGDMTLPLFKCHLLVLGGPVECGQLEDKLSCHCAVTVLIGKSDLSGFKCGIAHNGAEWRIKFGFESARWFCGVWDGG